jgi:hypothetical protein
VRFRQALIVGIAVLVVAACSGDDDADESGNTTTTAPTITTLGDSETVAGGTESDQAGAAATTSTTTAVALELSFPEYSIVSREASENGDIVVVLLDRTSYESLSDLDVHNVVSDLVEQYAPVYEAYIVETEAAADALFVEEPTEEEQTALSIGYVARLEEGFRIVYEGPLADSGVAILGS